MLNLKNNFGNNIKGDIPKMPQRNWQCAAPIWTMYQLEYLNFKKLYAWPLSMDGVQLPQG